ncbi:MAG: hypothetical protein RO009_19965 [Pseudorhodoplanes sp.]|nr:hypothetical protein [Pseudorhodoplanes sp.]
MLPPVDPKQNGQARREQSWFDFMVPAGIPRTIIHKVNRDAVAGCRTLQEGLAKHGAIIAVVAATQTRFDIIKNDTDRHSKLFVAAGIAAK